MTPHYGFAYLGGAVAALAAQPFGWMIATPAGWGVISALVERGARP